MLDRFEGFELELGGRDLADRLSGRVSLALGAMHFFVLVDDDLRQWIERTEGQEVDYLMRRCRMLGKRAELDVGGTCRLEIVRKTNRAKWFLRCTLMRGPSVRLSLLDP